MSIAAWLVAMVGPLAAQVLLSFGLSMVVLTGLSTAFGVLKDQVLANLASLPAQAIGLGGLFGLWEALGIYLGALTFCITWRSTKGFWALAKACAGS